MERKEEKEKGNPSKVSSKKKKKSMKNGEILWGQEETNQATSNNEG